MATAAKNVVVIQDASKTLNLRVFYWIIDGLSLGPEDMVTLVLILHEFHTPMGYKIIVDKHLLGVNQRIIEKELANKRKGYLIDEGLAQIVKRYETNKIVFKIKLFPASSPKDVALEQAINLKATWVILDRQLKKDEKFFLEKLSCGVSILKRNNRIVHLRGRTDLPDEIQCNSHDIDDESLPSVLDELNLIQRRLGCSTITTNINEETCRMDETERDEQGQDQEQIQSLHEGDTTTVIKNDRITDGEAGDQTNQHEEKTNNFLKGEKWDLRNPTKSEEMIDQPIEDPLCPNRSQTLSISNGVIMDEEEDKSILENSMLTFCSVCKTRRPNIGLKKEFTYEELQATTDAFSLKNCLSESGSLFTFQGQMEGGMKLVIKQHDVTNTHVRERMKSEIQTVLKARHKNVIMLLGSSTAENFLFTIYEYACNGSLDKYLSKENSRPLTWKERKRVAVGLARGLKYLHDNNIVHCNIKPSNILLTHDFTPLIGDIGFGKQLELKSYKNKSKGNFEYTAPEYQENGKLTTKTDVYSFGVVILQLITGRRTKDLLSEDKNLVEWAKPLLKRKKYSELVDPIIRNSYEEDHFCWLVQVTTQCLKKNPKERSSMNVAVSALQGITDSEFCHVTEDNSPVVPDSRNVPDINGSQGPITTEADQASQEEEQIESRFYGEEKKSRLTVENNHFYEIGQRNSDNHIEEQLQRRPLPQGEESSSGDHEMNQTVIDQQSEFEEHISNTLHRACKAKQKISVNHIIGPTKGGQRNPDQEDESCFVENKKGLILEPIGGMIDQTKEDEMVQNKMQTQQNCHENLQDGHQGEIILENSKSSVCSICKSRRPNNSWSKDFTHDELLEATKEFSTENSLSESIDGPTFEGLLERQVRVVVKKYQISTSHEEKILKSEVKLLISARHKNVVMLLGSCTSKSQLMIVYEKVCNGSLEQYLTRGSFQSLTWKQRLKVTMGIARGLKYLHGNNIIHGNIKPSNILLTHDFEPRIGDFGFGKVKLGPKKCNKDKSVRISGYAAPEYLENGKLSNKSDVYSFGVVLLELISGRRASDKLPGGKSLVGWARPLLSGKKYPPLLDMKINNSYEEEKLLWLVQVTEQCLKKNPKDRFTMNMILSALQGIEEESECCVIEDSFPRKSLPHDDHTMIGNTQGQVKADPVKHEQEWIDKSQYEEEGNLRLTVKTNDITYQRNVDQLIQDREDVQSSPYEMSRVTVISNDVIDQKNPDHQIQEKLHIKESCGEDFMNLNEAKIILETSESSVCSICKSSRPNSGLQKKYTYEELEGATEGFSIKYSLCEGEYGHAFRGQLGNNQGIVIKQHAFTSLEEHKVFMSEFQLLVNARHENVIMLLGSCIRLSELLIVYEKACNGSLDRYLSRKSGRSLTWEERVKVAIGVAKGLKYLHENNIIHGGIKPSNILLNHEFKPMVGDFVFGKERCDSKNLCSNKREEKCGYTAPECQERGELSTKADVYSFGVVLVELITGHMIADKIARQRCLVECVRSLIEERKYLQFVDPKLNNSYDEQELISLIHVTKNCLRKNPNERFTMIMVVSALSDVLDSNDIYVKKDFSQENKNLWDVTNSKGEEESWKEKDLGPENTEDVRMNPREGETEKSSEKDNIDTKSSEKKVRRNHRGEEETLKEEDYGTENSKKEEDNITCSRGNTECGNYTKCGESSKRTQESSSTKVCKKWEGCLSYGGAREFYLQGDQEFTVCEDFFSWCNSI